MLFGKIKNIASKSPVLVSLYSQWIFLRKNSIGGFFKDLSNPGKLKLALTVCPYTLLSYARLSALYELARRLRREKVNGSYVECGVWNGGSSGMVGAVLKDDGRHFWLFDSWEGLPEPTEYDIAYDGEHGEKGVLPSTEEKVRGLLFGQVKMNKDTTHLVKGWFDKTLPVTKKDIGEIALLHVDGDWYESVKTSMEELYDSVIRGGFIVIDDYGHWQGARKAVDDFLAQRNLKVNLVKIDYTGIYFQKP